jgi:hypothetical protein
MTIQPSNLFSLYHFAPGRRGWMATQIKRIAEGLQMGPLAARCDMILMVERGLRGEVTNWSMVGPNANGSALSQELVASDQRRNRLLSAFDAHLEGLVALPNAAESRPAELILKRLFPSGSAAVITLRWPEESAIIDMLVDDLKKGLHDDVVAAKVESWVAALETENNDFNTYYANTGTDRQVSWGSMRNADIAAQERFLELSAFILDLARGDGQGVLRDLLITPVMSQQRELKELYRKRTGIGDLNPDNGQPLNQ